MLDQIVAHLQARLDELKEEFHLFLVEKRNLFDPDIKKALFGEDNELPLLVGCTNTHVMAILEQRLHDKNPFDDIQLCKEIMGEVEMDPESEDNLREREGMIYEIIAVYRILGLDDKAEEASQLFYFN